MERVSDRMRYVAARYAMLRYSEEVTTDIKLRKCTSADNTADGFTKPLTGPALLRSRAQMLGHDDPQALAYAGPAPSQRGNFSLNRRRRHKPPFPSPYATSDSGATSIVDFTMMNDCSRPGRRT
jgi:hypothetical protein